MTEATKKPSGSGRGAGGLYAKLLVAQTNASGVEKQGRNVDQNYSYARAEDVIAEAQRALHDAELVGYTRPGEREIQRVESQRGTAGLFVTQALALVIVDPDSGDTLELEGFVGTGVDYPGDKAIYKALTGGAKYAYAAALGIPFGDDPEDSSSTSPEARETAKHSGAEATTAQKSAMTRNFNEAGVAEGLRKQIVSAIAGDPPSKAGASEILDLLIPASKAGEAKLHAAIEQLIERAAITPPSDVPGDDEGVVPVSGTTPVDAGEQGILDADPGSPEDDPDSLETRAEPRDGNA